MVVTICTTCEICPGVTTFVNATGDRSATIESNDNAAAADDDDDDDDALLAVIVLLLLLLLIIGSIR